MSEQGTIRKLNVGYEAVFERRLPHPPDRVWAMITDPNEIRKWYVRTELEPRPGGRIVEHHDHVGWSMTGRITRYDPPRTFEHTWSEEDGEKEVAGRVRWELYPDGKGTRLVLTNWFQRLDDSHGILAGWHICLDVMADILGGAAPGASAPPRGAFRDGHFTQTHPGRGRWARRETLEKDYQQYVATMAA